jgi:hypothetical protein
MSQLLITPSFSKFSLSSQPKRTTKRTTNRQPISRRCVCAASGGNGKDTKSIFDLAVAEPISFLGGIVAGFLALDISQDPLKTWIDSRAAESGIVYQAAKERLEEQRRKNMSNN